MSRPLDYSRQKRIRTTQEYRLVYEQGRKATCANLKLYFLQGSRKSFGIVISKRIKGSVIRNRYKRVLREFFRLKQNDIRSGIQIVAVVNQPIPTPTLKYYEREFKNSRAFQEYIINKSEIG